MAQCQNCNTKLSCGCQRRVASDGKSVCSTCLERYEKGLKQKNTKPSNDLSSTTPTDVYIVVNQGWKKV